MTSTYKYASIMDFSHSTKIENLNGLVSPGEHLQISSLSIFPVFIFLKPSRPREIPVGVLFRRTFDHFNNGWQSEPRHLVPTHTNQEVKDPTEESRNSSPLTRMPFIVRYLDFKLSGFIL